MLKPGHDTTRGTCLVVTGFGSSKQAGCSLFAIARVLRMVQGSGRGEEAPVHSIQLQQKGDTKFKCELLIPTGCQTDAGAQCYGPSGFSLPWIRAERVKQRVDMEAVPNTFNGYLPVDFIVDLAKDKWHMLDAVSCDKLVVDGEDVEEIPSAESDECPTTCYMCMSGFHDDKSGKGVQCVFPGKSCGRWWHQMCHDPPITADDFDNFQCGVCSGEDGKICYKCRREYTAPSDNDELVACDYCDKWVHQTCHLPILESVPKGKFKCPVCVETQEKRKRKTEAARRQKAAQKEAVLLSRQIHGRGGVTTRSGRVTQVVQTNNPDLRQLSPRRTRMQRMCQ